MRGEYRRPSPVGAMVVGAAVTVVALLPVFLTGAMAVQLTAELGFSSAGLGLAIAAYRSGGAVTAVSLGRLTDRLGAMRSIRLAGLIAAVTALGIATTARGLTGLVLWLAFGGSALALAQPGANRLLAAVVDPRRLGTAFGFKQSAPPIASMIAGASVPMIAVTVGWRWGYVLAAAAAVLLLLRINPPPPRPADQRTKDRTDTPRLTGRGVIVLLSVAFGLGTSTSSSVTTFYVSAAAAAGSTPRFAGTMLAAASICAIGARVVAGVLSDRMVRGHMALCAVMLTTGAAGIGLLATAEQALMSLGIALALIGSWGFNGVFWYALIRAYPGSPGRITGAASPGGLIGSTLGPLVFGIVTQQLGYAPAWATFSGMALLAAATMVYGNRRLNRATSA